MRTWLLITALVPLAAQASNVLIVAGDETSRGLNDAVVDVFSQIDLQVKVAGPKAPAVACTKEADEAVRHRCLSEAATQANVSCVLVITATEKKGVTTAAVELIAQSNGKLVKKLTLKAPTAKWEQKAAPQLKSLKPQILAQRFVEQVLAPEPVRPEPPKEDKEPPPPQAVEVKPTPEPVKELPPSDRPTDVSLVPSESKPEVELDAEGTKGPNVAAWTMAGSAVVAAGISGTFALLGNGAKGRLETISGGRSALSYNQAVSLRSEANTDMTVALTAAITAGVAATIAAILWGTAK